MSANEKKAASRGRYTNKKRDGISGEAFVDKAGVLLQQLRAEGRLADERPLVRIDYRDQARDAPFRFDSTSGKLHRKECKAIPREAQSVLYAVWSIGPDDPDCICEKCKPEAGRDGQPAITSTDLLFGLLSIFDQFGTILYERGRDFRRTKRGKELEKSIGTVIGDLDRTNRNGLGFIVSTLDTVIAGLNDYNKQVAEPSPSEKKSPRQKHSTE